MSPFVLGLALPWVIVALGCWLGYQLVRQNGRILLRLDTIEQELASIKSARAAAAAGQPPPSGLAMGVPAPAFELPTLDGGHMSLSELHGQHVLLIFFNPGCGFCQKMTPDLAALPADGPLRLIIVSTGDPEANRRLIQQHGIRIPVLLQKQMEVASLYQVNGTPMGYLIDERGNIASQRAVGAQALLALVPPTGAAKSQRAPENENGHNLHRGNRPLETSRLIRNGLPAGARAPAFRLPRLDGGELSLEEYRGRRVLLVFSDPHCGPCEQLAPELERQQRRASDLSVVMVSRGDRHANQAKVDKYKLTFPVALQRQWEISRDYGMFGTPIAYLIDEGGMIAADVAVGVEPILGLLSSAIARASRKEVVPMS